MSSVETDCASQVRPIASAAVALEFVEKSALRPRQMQTRLSEEFDRQHGSFYRPISITTTVKRYVLEQIVLDADTVLLLQDGLPIPETSYFIPAHRSDRPTIAEDAMIRLDANEDWIMGYNNAHAGYQHWLTQCVPAIDWSLRETRVRPPRLILPRLSSWQEETLGILNVRTVPRLTAQVGQQYLLPHAAYTEFLNGSTAFGICLSALDTARRLSSGVPPVTTPHRVLYVPYRDPYYGAIVNAPEVLELLQNRGVFVVDESRDKVADRINLFRNADVVIGPHGGDLVDVLFCKPGALLWEWMPGDFQNASINRLAQAADVDYWGDILESVSPPDAPRQLRIDPAIVRRRLAEISERLALSDAQPVPRVIRDGGPVATKFSPGKPIDELILAFESLGDNCEFGLVQRYGRVEPLGLLRFGGISFERLIAGLERRFDGLGTPGTIEVELAGGPGHREFMVRESVYGIRYHSGVVEGEITLGAMLERETRRLAFLRRKLLEDLRSGEKIFVWKSPETTNIAQVRPILDALRIQGPNVLLWVVEADQTHAEGTAERLDKYLLKGYIERFAPYEDAADIRPVSWFKVCQAAYLLCHPEQQQETSEPAVATTVSAQRPLTAFEILALHAVEDRPLSLPAGSSKRNWLQRVLAWLRFRGPN